MKTETIVMCVVALILGILMANMLKSVCGCNTVEGVQDRWNCRDPVTNSIYTCSKTDYDKQRTGGGGGGGHDHGGHNPEGNLN